MPYLQGKRPCVLFINTGKPGFILFEKLTFLRIHRRYCLCGAAAIVPPAAYFFLSCQKKVCKKEAQGYEIALTRLINQFVTPCVLSFRYRSPNALRAAVQSGFPIARYAVQIALFVPVEYLTYGIQGVSDIKRLVGADDSVCPTSPQSISTTTPVCPIRIGIAFRQSVKNLGTNQTPGKIQGRGPQPPSWSF